MITWRGVKLTLNDFIGTKLKIVPKDWKVFIPESRRPKIVVFDENGIKCEYNGIITRYKVNIYAVSTDIEDMYIDENCESGKIWFVKFTGDSEYKQII